MEHLEKFASFIHATRYEAVPESVITRAKLILADCVAAIVGGMAEPEMQNLVETTPTSGLANILGTSVSADMMTASFINGTAGTVLEMDEGSQFARGHPGMHVFPALLAAAQIQPISEKEFLSAFIVGYDIAARIGIGTSLNPHMHPHGTWGGLGAAAALANFYKLDTHKISSLLNIASSLTLATSRKTMLEGGTVRNTYTGISNQMAHLSYQLLKSGFTGERDGIYSVFGTVVSSQFNAELACELLGERYEVERNYFKLHACCRYNHAALDALWLLMERHNSLENIHQIDSISVKSYVLAAELTEQRPQNVLASKFSVPFALATTLVNRSSGVLSFTNSSLENPDIISLAAKITVTDEPSMSKKLPDFRPAEVIISLVDGTVLKETVETNKGDWRDPYNEEQLRTKFLDLTARLWPKDKSALIYEEIKEMGTKGDILFTLKL